MDILSSKFNEHGFPVRDPKSIKRIARKRYDHSSFVQARIAQRIRKINSSIIYVLGLILDPWI